MKLKKERLGFAAKLPSVYSRCGMNKGTVSDNVEC